MSLIDRQPNAYIIGAITPETAKKRIDDVKVAQVEELIESGAFGRIYIKDDIESLSNTSGSIFDLSSRDYNFDPDDLL